MTTLEFINAIKALRKGKKNKWVNRAYEVNGYKVGIKSFDAWIQRIEVSKDRVLLYTSFTDPDCTVKAFNNCLLDAMKEVA